MVALTIRTWHGLMLAAEMFSIAVYVVSLIILKDFFGEIVYSGGSGQYTSVLALRILETHKIHLHNLECGYFI